jgi:hypothetical protein
MPPESTHQQLRGKEKEAGHYSGLKENNTLKSLLRVTTANDVRLTKRRFTASHQFW